MKKTEIQRIVGATAGVFVLLLLLYAVSGMIKQSRQQLGVTQKELLKNLPGASFICHADDTSILYANDELIQLFECDSREDFNRFSLGLFKNLIAQAKYRHHETFGDLHFVTSMDLGEQ